MKSFLFFSLSLFLFCACAENKSEMPSGSPKDVLASEIYMQVSKAYDVVLDFEFGYAIVKREKYGMIDSSGKEIVKCIYDTIFTFNDDAKIVKEDNRFGVIQYNGDRVTGLEYDDFLDDSDYLSYVPNRTLIVLKKGDRWGAILSDGKIVIPFEYDVIANVENGYVVCGKNRKYGIVDSLGNIKIAIGYDTIFLNYENSGISLVKKESNIGIANSKGQLVTECIYNCDFLLDGALPMVDIPKNGYIKLEIYKPSASNPVLCGMVNCETGTVSIPFVYDDMGSYSEGLVWVKKNSKYGYVDINNKFVVRLKYDKAYDFSEGLAAVERYTGKFVYTQMGLTPERKTGFINKYGNQVIPFQYNTQVGNDPVFSEGLAVIGMSSNNIYGIEKGYIDKSGKIVIPPTFTSAKPFEKGLAEVSKKDKVGFINKLGKEVIPIKYVSVYYDDSIIICSNEDETEEKYINRNGKVKRITD